MKVLILSLCLVMTACAHTAKAPQKAWKKAEKLTQCEPKSLCAELSKAHCEKPYKAFYGDWLGDGRLAVWCTYRIR